VEIVVVQDRLERALTLAAGVPEGHARLIADVIMDSELRGYDDHGVWFLGRMLEWYATGGLNPAPQVRVIDESATTVLLDGDQGCGVIAATEAMTRCIAKAREYGMASAAVRNSGNLIVAAPFALQAAEAGLIGFATTNAPPLAAPTGGITRTFGTNPFAYAIPTGRHFPFLLDMSTTATAAAKVMVARQEGRRLAPGLIEDAQGQPTDDPNAFFAGGAMVPLGGPKGYGLAMVVDALAGVLAGTPFARDLTMRAAPVGHFFWSLDVARYLPREEFLARMDAQIEQVKSGARKPGVEEILIPGERGQRRKRDLLARGRLPLQPAGWQALQDICTRAGLAAPEPTGTIAP
jgi:LDH2 family malate/lactate/ureidoglycolate dehydrogenase